MKKRKKMSRSLALRLSTFLATIFYIVILGTLLSNGEMETDIYSVILAIAIIGVTFMVGLVSYAIMDTIFSLYDKKEIKDFPFLKKEEFTKVFFNDSLVRKIQELDEISVYAKLTENGNIHIVVKSKDNKKIDSFIISDFEEFEKTFIESP